MQTHLPALIIPFFVALTLESLISFTNPTSTTAYTQQQCSDGGYIDVCCIPLDLDLGDDKGYGWFHPEQASLQNFDGIDVFSAVYRNSPTLAPCYGEATVTKSTHRDWKSPVFRQMPYLSGVLVQRSFRPLFARKMVPHNISVEARQYLWDGVLSVPMLFEDSDGNVIRGRPFGFAVQLNSTDVAIR